MSDRIFASTTAATGTDGAVAQAVRAALCHLPGVDEAGSAHLVGLASDMAIMSLLALSAYLMLLVGRVSFGQQAFFGVGAYGAGVMTALFNVPLPLALLVGMALGAACSWLLALPTMRLSGLNYAVATLAFGEMARITFSWFHWQVNTADGPVGPAGLEGFRDIRWLLENNLAPEVYLLITLAILAMVLGLLVWNERTRLGVGLRMIGQDDLLTASQGVAVERLRLLAAAAAGALAALGGGLYAHRTTYIEPALFDPMLGVHAVGYALLGGLGTALGPLLGVVLDLGLLDASRVLPGWRMVIFGGLVALFLRWRPRGLLDEVLVHRISQAWARWRRPGLPPAGPRPMNSSRVGRASGETLP
ncbi:MAG: branched-chain amino acid ABC transporter permease [Burkholderiaceae bacterium]